MAILSKGTDFTTGDQVTAAKLDALVDSATFAAGAVDDSTTALDSSTPKKIIVKNGGISSTQLANDSVTTVKVENNAITLAKMATQADQTVLGNVSGGTAVPTAVPIVGAAGILVNNDSLGTDDTKGATQGNIKAYVDTTAGPTVGFNPTSYTGGETTTLPNGLTIKFGSITSGIPSFGVEGTITFANAFDTACLYANIITNNYNGVGNANNTIESVSVSNIKYKHGMNPAVTKIYWQAIGH